MMQFERIRLLVGEKFNNLKNSSVLIIGLGGVGGYALEALARSGITNLIIVDSDTIDITNLNRQVISNLNNVGSLKVDEWEKRIKSINDQVNIIKINEFITPQNIDKLFEYKFDYLIDACDTINTKKEIIKMCINKNIKFISCMGTGKKFHPEMLEVSDLKKTSYDPIAKKLRKMLKDDGIIGKIPVVYSKEIPKKIASTTIGSTMFVPSVAGIMCANYIFNMIIGDINENS